MPALAAYAVCNCGVTGEQHYNGRESERFAGEQEMSMNSLLSVDKLCPSDKAWLNFCRASAGRLVGDFKHK